MFVDDSNTDGSDDKQRQCSQTTPPDDGIAKQIHAIVGPGKRLTLATQRMQATIEYRFTYTGRQ